MLLTDDYTKEDVKRLLGNYTYLDELNAFSQDGMPIIYKTDIDRALLSDHLQEAHLEVIGLHYACELSFMQIQMYIGTPIETSMKALTEAVRIITDVLNGDIDYVARTYTSTLHAYNLQAYAYQVSHCLQSPYDIPDSVQTHILDLTKQRDILAEETLRQRKEGKPTSFELDTPEETLYPFHAEAIHTGSRFKDYFTNQDRKNGVGFDDFESYAKGQITTGSKKTNVSNDSVTNRKAVRR